MRIFRKACAAFVCTLSVMTASAQRTTDEMQLLTVNENVTTVITASEPVRFVDIRPTRWWVTNLSTIPSD